MVACSSSASCGSSGRPPERFGQAGGAAGPQGLQWQVGEQTGGPHPVCPLLEVPVLVGVVGAGCRGHHQGRVGCQGQAERQERQRLRVAPLDAVEGQQHGAAAADQRPRQAFEEPEALPGVDHRSDAGAGFRAGRAGRYEPVDLGAPDRVERGERGLHRGGTEPVRYRGQGEPSGRSEALGAGHHRRGLCAGAVGDLGDQAGLADAGAAGDEDEGGVPGGRRAPRLVQPTEFACASDECRGGESGPLGRRSGDGAGGRGGVRGGEQAVGEGARRRVRCQPEFTFEDGGAAVIGAHCAGAVAVLGLQGHQGAVPALFQGSEGDPAADGVDRPGEVAGARPEPAQQIAQVDAVPFEIRSGLEDPVVVHAGQQGAAVFGERGGGVPQRRLVVAAGRGRPGGLVLDGEGP